MYSCWVVGGAYVLGGTYVLVSGELHGVAKFAVWCLFTLGLACLLFFGEAA